MKNKIYKMTLSCVVLLAVMIFSGCASTTIYDPETTTTNLRDPLNVSQEEMRQVARAAIQDVLCSPRFVNYVNSFRASRGRRPILKLDHTINDTNDPNLNVAVITDTLERELLNADIVDVTLAEGAERTQAISNSRLNINDPTFNSAAVARDNTLMSANIILRPKVVSAMSADGRTKNVERFFVVDLANIDDGLIIWKYNKALGFTTTRDVVGW
ncbi:hypothetical protein J6T93_04775 [bacterium]|nr:hypothetical protein [bacterium]